MKWENCKKFESKHKVNLKLPVRKYENQLRLHRRMHKRLRNWGHWKLGKGQTQHKESQVYPKTPFQNLHNWATYSSSSQQKTEGLSPRQGKTEGLWIGRHWDRWVKSKLYQILRPMLQVLFHHSKTKLPAAGLQPLVTSL